MRAIGKERRAEERSWGYFSLVPSAPEGQLDLDQLWPLERSKLSIRGKRK